MSAGFAVRRADGADAARLSALGRATFASTFGHLYAREDLDDFLDTDHSPAAYDALLHDARYAVFVAHGGGADIAYAVAGPDGLPRPDGFAPGGELKRLYVDASAQGAKIGPLLMSLGLSFLRDAGYRDVYISVYAENFRAQALYAKAGFAEISRYFYMVGRHADPEIILHAPIDRIVL